MSIKRTYIRPDETLYVDGKLIVRGNVTQIEDTVYVNNLQSNALVINTDADTMTSAVILRSSENTLVDGSVAYDGVNLILSPSVALSGNLTVSNVFVDTQLEFSNTADFGDNATASIREKFAVSNVVQPWTNTNLSYNAITGVTTYVAVQNSEIYGLFARVTIQDASDWTDSRLEYAAGTYTYFAPTQSEVRDTVSVSSTTDPSGWSNADLVYNNGTGVFAYTAPTQSEVRNTISLTATLDNSWSANQFTYDPVTGVLAYVGPTLAELRDTISVVDLGGQGSLTYDNITGVITYTGASQSEANTAILDFITATYGVNLDPDGNLYVDLTETATLADDQVFTGNKVFQADVDLEAANVSGFTVNGELVVDGNLNVLGNINSVTQVDLFVTDTQITLNANAAVGMDSYVWVDRGVDPDTAIRWEEGLNQWQFTNDGTNYQPIPDSTTVLVEGDNLYYTTSRANAALDAYLVAGAGLIRTGSQYVIDVGQGDGITVAADNVSVDATVVRTTGDFNLSGNLTLDGEVTFTGSVALPGVPSNANGAVYYQNTTNQAFIVIDGQPIEITPATDYGTIENAPGSELGTAPVLAGTRQVQVGNANVIYAGIKSISVGANMSLTDTGNVITLDADGLNLAEVRDSLSVLDNGGFGDLSYNNITGAFTYTGVSVANIRSQISASGLISYNSSTGAITTTADLYSQWNFQTDTGGSVPVPSNGTITINGSNGVLVTNAGNVITVTGSGGDITDVNAGDGLSGGGNTGSVTLNVDNTVIRTTGGQTITGDFTVTGIINGTATSAQYADLAEVYAADKHYTPGTVMVIGGRQEVTRCESRCDHRVAGVVSTNPAHLMNAGYQCDHPVSIALRGRVPVWVVGVVHRGDILITSDTPGVAQAATDPVSVPASCIVGKALTGTPDGECNSVNLIEVMV